jgi:2-polyprenyl-6-methoxyphenol hydroxylase-like FAD-dependent oxidoreductase
MFVERRSLLQVLFDNIKDKTKVLTDHHVEQILSSSETVRVRVKSGVIITGDILVGADGVHSTVRREMWRQAEKLAPGYFPKDEASSEF